jgi:serine/threonine protein kinase
MVAPAAEVTGVESNAQSGALTGAVLGGVYEVTRLVGEGGMGAVYEAVQLRLNKRVAIKVMARELASNEEALARFRREAEVTSHLGHPHLVNVMDFGTTDSGEPYLVMEYLDGEDLDHRIRYLGRLPLETAVAITRQVASALAAAHDQGIVHRDLKPANVFLVKVKGEADFVKVLDFGISKIKASRTKLTRATAVMGTPEYMSPEQATGMIEEIDHRADQWALACIAWEMLSGHAPFIADDMSALFYQVINMDPHPLSRRAPGLPPEVEPVLRRALAKQAADRFPSIKDFARAFEAAATGFARELTPPPVAISRTPSAKGTAAYTARSPSAKPGRPSPQPGIIAAGKSRDDLGERGATRKSLRVYFVVGGALVLLTVGVIMLWPRKPQMSVLPTPARVVPRSPEVVTLPAPAPSITNPPPSPEPVPSRTTKVKPSRGASTDRPGKTSPPENASSGGKKPTPSVDPFASDPPGGKPAEHKPTKARPQRQIIEEL